ncbi:LuxR family transcriptional regulator, partial [Rhizobium ruizarguesonis]
VRWEKVNIIVDDNMAWMTFDQIGSATGEDRKRQLRLLPRIDGAWKIGCMVMIASSVEAANCPLISVDVDANILWP